MISFGTGGFRGVIADTFTKENIQIIAQAVANIIKKRNSKASVVVGYDYRFISDQAGAWVSEVMAGNGIRVILSDCAVPTPAVMYLTKKLNNDFGFMITASHNPYYFNGIKVFQKDGMDADVLLTGQIEEEIKACVRPKILDSYKAEYKSLVSREDILTPYLDNISSFISDEIKGNNIKVLFDAIHGTGAITLSRLQKRYELKNFEMINSEHEAFFGFMLPNPTKENMLKDKSLVLENGFDCAVGIDSDGDRLGMLDENGSYVDSNEILASLYYYLVKYKGQKGDIVKNCATSNLLDELAKKFAYKCHEVDVGFKNISSAIRKYDALIGGESSGGLTVRNYIFGKDSTFATMLVLEMMIVMNKKLSQIIKEVREYANFNYTILEAGAGFIEGTDIKSYLYNNMPKFTQKPIEVRKFGQNVKYIFENNEWALLRISGTEPMLRLFVEMQTKEKASAVLAVLKEFIAELNKGD